jgi:hypothetical protein
MISNKLKKIATMRAKLVALEKSVAIERSKELADLPARYGFENAEGFVKAVKAAGSGKRRQSSKAGLSGAGNRRRKRAHITDETRAEVKKMVGEGKTGNEIAKATGISLPSVQNIKASLGLVKKRK